MRKSNKKRGFPKILIVLIILLVVFFSLFFTYKYLLKEYKIETAYVEGSEHYTDDEIRSFVMSGKYGDNSLYLSHKYKDKEIKDIPFIETISVNVLSKNSIKITVYEKALAGFVDYLGKIVYFDKDGIVVEISNVKTKGIPEVVGVKFDYVILHEKLPCKDDSLYLKVLNITKLCSKYEVSVDKLYIDDFGEITLYKDEISVKLGKDKDIDIKIMNLPSILSKLEGKKGTLRMENYNEETKRVSFEIEE